MIPGYKKFYNDCALFLWEEMTGSRVGAGASAGTKGTKGFSTHDSIMKQAQLGNALLDCTALLVDES